MAVAWPRDGRQTQFPLRSRIPCWDTPGAARRGIPGAAAIFEDGAGVRAESRRGPLAGAQALDRPPTDDRWFGRSDGRGVVPCTRRQRCHVLERTSKHPCRCRQAWMGTSALAASDRQPQHRHLSAHAPHRTGDLAWGVSMDGFGDKQPFSRLKRSKRDVTIGCLRASAVFASVPSCR